MLAHQLFRAGSPRSMILELDDTKPVHSHASVTDVRRPRHTKTLSYITVPGTERGSAAAHDSI
eukprot:2658546-Prymnesium_polylepis.1